MLVSEGCKFSFFNGKDRMWSKSQPGVVTSSTSGNWRQVPRRKFSLPKEIGKTKKIIQIWVFSTRETEKNNNYNYSNHLSKFGKIVEKWMIHNEINHFGQFSQFKHFFAKECIAKKPLTHQSVGSTPAAWAQPLQHPACGVVLQNSVGTTCQRQSHMLMDEILHHLGWLKPYK